MSSKPTHQTAARILAVSLALYNRFGEANVSTSLITKELSISPGNLYYHFSSKDELTNALLDRYTQQIEPFVRVSHQVAHLEDAWFVLHSWLEHIRDYRFIYRDINDLISRNRHLERQFQNLLKRKYQAMQDILNGLQHHGILDILPDERERLSTQMVLTLNYWLSFEYALQPRLAEQSEHVQLGLQRGACQLLGLLSPYLQAADRHELDRLMRLYQTG
jgi:AcrR family transcriptional regulator